MGIYSEVIRKRDENNRLLEDYADRSLWKNGNALRPEDAVSDAQSAVLFILDKFSLAANRQYGMRDVETMIETLLDPLDIMFDYVDAVPDHRESKTKYMLAFREDGRAVALFPSLFGYRYYCPSDSSSGFATKQYCGKLKRGCYVFHRPLPEGSGTVWTFATYVLQTLDAWSILRLIAATCLSTLLGLVIPTISQWVYKAYIPNPTDTGAWFALALALYLSVIVARAALGTIKSAILSAAKVRVSTSVQSAVMARTLSRPL